MSPPVGDANPTPIEGFISGLIIGLKGEYRTKIVDNSAVADLIIILDRGTPQTKIWIKKGKHPASNEAQCLLTNNLVSLYPKNFKLTDMGFPDAIDMNNLPPEEVLLSSKQPVLYIEFNLEEYAAILDADQANAVQEYQQRVRT